MPVKTTGLEWRKFYSDNSFWPKNSWHDEEHVLVDGAEPGDDFNFDEVADETVLTVSGGVVFLNEDATDGPSLEAYFRRWKKKQTTSLLIVEVPREAADTMRALIVAAGGKVRA